MIDNWTRQRRGESFFAFGSIEEKGTFQLKANTKHEIFVVFCNVRGPADGDEDETIMIAYLFFLSSQNWISLTKGHLPILAS